MPYPPCGPNLAACDFWLFPLLKDRLAAMMFSHVQDLGKTVNSDLRSILLNDYLRRLH